MSLFEKIGELLIQVRDLKSTMGISESHIVRINNQLKSLEKGKIFANEFDIESHKNEIGRLESYLKGHEDEIQAYHDCVEKLKSKLEFPDHRYKIGDSVVYRVEDKVFLSVGDFTEEEL